MDFILTFDYETYGNGAGDFFEKVIKPTELFLKICHDYDIKATIFFEILEYLKIKQGWESGNKMGYVNNPAKAIEEQILYAHNSGHDIQLHLHPQWINAVYDDGWKVDNSLWRLPDVAKSNCGYTLYELIRLGKDTIREVLRDPNYSCNVLRAGGFNIYPSQEICFALRDNGFRADSSVCVGRSANDLSRYDYSMIDERIPYWFARDDDLLIQEIEYKEKNSILEIPVFAQNILQYRLIDLQRLKVNLKNRDYSFQKLSNNNRKENYLQKFKKYFNKASLTWDYCLLPYSKLKRLYFKAKEIEENSPINYHPRVLIGHSKEFYYSNNFTKFIRFVQKRDGQFKTFGDVLKKVLQGNHVL